MNGNDGKKKKPHALKYNNPKSASSNAEGGFGRYIVPTGPQTCIYIYDC